mmetsp:Transcript_12737/g.43069  ORF Transcript_12737/g.43069 Transcript_12737/m.43069 type:complete len:211 (+) Transcript_12737:68-700(+)
MARPRLGDVLPAWMFDVEEGPDEVPGEALPLLEELEIDFNLILRTVAWMLVRPWSRGDGSTPFNEDSHEFWGPFIVVLLYGIVLLGGQFRDLPWVLVIWLCASGFVHLTLRLQRPQVVMGLSFAILGYSVIPLIPVALVLLVTRVRGLPLTLLQFFGVVWSSRCAILGFTQSLKLGAVEGAAGRRDRPLLLLFPIVLMELYFASLVSARN